MVAAIKEFVSKLFGARGRAYELWNVEFVPVDLDRVSKELRIDEQAQNNGADGLPAADETVPDYPHKSIENYFTQQIADLHTKAANRLTQYRQIAGDGDFDARMNELAGTPSRFRNNVEQRISRFSDELKDQTTKLAAAEKDLVDFKSSHGINREPTHPRNLFLYICIPLFLLGIDVAFNAAVFKDASPTGQGLKGGILTALLLALFNVVLAAVLGFLFRFKNSPYVVGKFVGWFSAFGLACFLPFNVFVAHYRDLVLRLKDISEALSFDQLVLQRQHVIADTFQQIFTNPFLLGGLESYGLFLVGFVIACFSAVDGYKIDDPMPGYKTTYRRVEELRGGLQEIKNEFRHEVQSAHDRESRYLEALEHEIESIIERSKSMSGLRSNLFVVYARQMESYIGSCEALILRYRQENRRARQNLVAPPKYFAERPPKLRVLSLDDGGDHARQRIVDSYLEMATSLQDNMNSTRDAVHGIWDGLHRKAAEIAS